MRIGLLIEYSVGNVFLQKSCIKLGKGASTRPLFAFKKAKSKWSASDQVKASGQHLNFNIVW